MELFWLGVFVGVSGMTTLIGLLKIAGIIMKICRRDKETTDCTDYTDNPINPSLQTPVLIGR